MVVDVTKIILRFSNFGLSCQERFKGNFRMFWRVPVFSCCFTVDSCPKTLDVWCKEKLIKPF